MIYACVCGAQTTKHNWCYEGKHQRRSPKPKHDTCSICGEKNRALGLCSFHYFKARRNKLKTTRKTTRKLTVNRQPTDTSDLWEFVKQELGI